jgi:predicted HTH domain antitoxin
MKAVTIDIPEAFAGTFGTTEAEAAKKVRLELAIQMYREGCWSTRSAAEFAGLDRWRFMEVLMARKVPFPYTPEMLAQDFAYARSRVG